MVCSFDLLTYLNLSFPMRHPYSLLAAMCVWPGLLLAQPRDTRAELVVDSAADELSISPDSRLWLTSAMGSTYHTDGVGQPWHYGPSLAGPDPSGLDAPRLDRIT